MTPEDFYAELSDIFEEPVTAGTRFKELPAWSSVTSLSVIMTIEEETGRRPAPADLLACETAAELFAITQRES